MVGKENLYINGINGISGEYLVSPLEYNQLARFIKNEQFDSTFISWLKRIWRTLSQPHLGLPWNVEPTNIHQAGWGIVFYTDEERAVKDAMMPLIEHRRRQVGDDTKVKILDYRNGEEYFDWLARYRVGTGSIDPTKIPYYLLLIGSPAHIPFSFGHLLNMEYAVGRLHFDHPSAYADYVASLISYESSDKLPNAKEAVFFATRHSFDRATQLSADMLVNPLAEGDQLVEPNSLTNGGFTIRKVWGNAATKRALSETLAPGKGVKSPAFLFTATHGIGLPRGDIRQLTVNGALLCQDWPGFGTVSSDHYFAGSDIPLSARVHGMITFHFACYGAGTPSHNRFFYKAGEPPPLIADRPFIAALPKDLLTHRQGGALACIGHVERAWGYSFITPKAGPQLQPFRNAISRILSGEPVGHAMKDFKERYVFLSTRLSSLLEKLNYDPTAVSDRDLARNWIERNDAESYIIVGDPAVHLRVNDFE